MLVSNSNRMRLLKIFLLLAAAVYPSCKWVLPYGVEYLARHYASKYELNNFDLSVSWVGLTETSIDAFSLGENNFVSASGIKFQYSPFDLFDSRKISLDVEDLRLRLLHERGEWQLPSFVSNKSADREATKFSLPIGKIRLAEFKLEAITSLGAYHLTAAPNLDLLANQKTEIHVPFLGAGPGVEFAGNFSATLDQQGYVYSETNLEKLHFSDFYGINAEVHGLLTMDGDVDAIESATAELSLNEPAYDNVAFPNSKLGFTYQHNRLSMLFNTQPNTRGLKADVSVEMNTQNYEKIPINLDLGLHLNAYTNPLLRIDSANGSLRVIGSSSLEELTGYFQNETEKRSWPISNVDLDLKLVKLVSAAVETELSVDAAIKVLANSEGMKIYPQRDIRIAIERYGGIVFNAPKNKESPGFVLSRNDHVLKVAVDLKESRLSPSGLPVFHGAIMGQINYPLGDGGAVSIDELTLNGRLENQKLAGINTEVEKIRLRMAGSSTRLDSILDADISFFTQVQKGDEPDFGEFKGGQLSASAALMYTENLLRVSIVDCWRLSLDEWRYQNYRLKMDQQLICGMDQIPLATIGFNDSGVATAELELQLAPGKEIQLSDESGKDLLNLLTPAVNAQFYTQEFPSSWTYAVAGSKGNAHFVQEQVKFRLQDFAINGVWGPELLGPAKIQLNASAQDLHAPAFFTPARIKLDANYQPPSINILGEVGLSKDRVIAELKASYQFDKKEGQASLLAPSIIFEKIGLQPEHIAPILKGQVVDVDGELEIFAEVEMLGNQLQSKGLLLVNDLSMETFFAKLGGINASVGIDQLYPFQTKAAQPVTIDLLDPGLPLTNGVLSVEVQEDLSILIANTSWPLAGGEISGQNIRWRSASSNQELTLNVEQMSLDELVKLTDLAELEATGLFSGKLPVYIENGVPYLRDAKLTDNGKGGVIRYRSANAEGVLASGGEAAGVLLQALENFHYRSAAITLDGALTGSVTVGIHLNGANPDLYAGYPVELNFDLQGQLIELLRSSTKGFRLSEELGEQLNQGE